MDRTSTPTWIALRARLESLAGNNPVMARLIRDKLPLTAEHYIDLNFMGELPDQLEDDEREAIELLRAY